MNHEGAFNLGQYARTHTRVHTDIHTRKHETHTGTLLSTHLNLRVRQAAHWEPKVTQNVKLPGPHVNAQHGITVSVK